MKRKRRILRLMCEIKRLRKENKQLHDKHWSECRQIALYDDEARKAKNMATALDLARMCDVSRCVGCPYYDYDSCYKAILANPKSANAAILKWCAEHPEQPESVSEQPTKPKKTYKEDFLEKFPDAVCLGNGSPICCCSEVYGKHMCKGDTCANCWNEVMPDD